MSTIEGMGNAHVSRRQLMLRLAGASGVGAALVACSAGTTPPPPVAAAGTVEFWYAGLGQSFIDAYKDMAKGLNEKNPKITVNVGPQDGFPDKVIVAAAAGTPPDSFNIQLIDALTFLPRGVYEPLDASIKARKYDLKALWPGLAEQYQYEGKQLVLWSQINTTVTYYNVDLFKQSGLVTPNDLAAQKKWTWDAALSAAQKLRTEDRYGFWTLTTPQSLQPWLWMNGGRGFDSEDKPTKVTMSEPASLAAMQWQADLRNRYQVAPTPPVLTTELSGQQRAFANGKLAMYTEQSSLAAVDAAVKGAGGFQWDIAPLPTGPKGLFGFIGGQSIGVTTGAKNKDAALEWLFHVVSAEGQKEAVRRQLGVPLIKAQLDSPEWKNAPSTPPHVSVVVEMLGKARAIARTNLWRTLATNAFNQNITRMNSGEISATEACKLMDDAGTKTLQAGV